MPVLSLPALTQYSAVLPAMLDYADSRKWVLLHDQVSGHAWCDWPALCAGNPQTALAPAASDDKICCPPQELVELFFRSNEAARFRQSWHRLTALPDAYNYKVRAGRGRAASFRHVCLAAVDVACKHILDGLHGSHAASSPQAYWGEPDAGWQGMFTHQVRAWRSIACQWVLLGIGIALGDTCTALAADCTCAPAWTRLARWPSCTPTAPSPR